MTKIVKIYPVILGTGKSWVNVYVYVCDYVLFMSLVYSVHLCAFQSVCIFPYTLKKRCVSVYVLLCVVCACVFGGELSTRDKVSIR